MRKKDVVYTIRLGEKARHYLSRLGIIDGRSGRPLKNKDPGLSRFINECLIAVCEGGYGLVGLADSDRLRESWIRLRIGELNRRIDRLRSEQVALARSLRSERVEESFVGDFVG